MTYPMLQISQKGTQDIHGVPVGHFVRREGRKVEDLGNKLIVSFLVCRPKAENYSDSKRRVSYNPQSALFRQIEFKASMGVEHYVSGMEYLVFNHLTRELNTYFAGLRTSRTLDLDVVSGDEVLAVHFTTRVWRYDVKATATPVVMKSNLLFDLEAADLEDAISDFQNPPDEELGIGEFLTPIRFTRDNTEYDLVASLFNKALDKVCPSKREQLLRRYLRNFVVWDQL